MAPLFNAISENNLSNNVSSTIAIHQFSPSCGLGDGISNGMFFTRNLLRELGFVSDIYCQLVPQELNEEVKLLALLEQDALNENNILLVHHSLGYENCAWLDQVKARKILIYHNITPPQYLPNNELPALSLLGREQLHQWHQNYLGAIGDSDFNSAELASAAYHNIQTIPLLVDIERMRSIACDNDYIKQWQGAYNIVFVGRFCEHKKQLDIIKMFQELEKNQPTALASKTTPLRLILVGGITSEAYFSQVTDYIATHHLQDRVIITGKISDQQLIAIYRSAHVYVSLSEHEGFGMPLLEAMLYDIPVIAKSYGAIASTMGKGGIVLPQNSSLKDIASHIYLLMAEPAYRRQILFNQRENCQRFERAPIQQQLVNYLESLGIAVPNKMHGAYPNVNENVNASQDLAQNTTNSALHYQIEGPFDSSYSLAIVNRELARALAKKDQNICLRSKEGFGDFEASAAFLFANPLFKEMVNNYQNTKNIAHAEVTLRNCYPPVVDDMQGCLKLINSYGWEETGFPSSYAQEFNLKLDLVTVVSQFVKKTLRDNGVRIPIAVVGNGVDHLLDIVAEPISTEQTHHWKSFRFLHISSCFPRKGVDALLAAYGAAFSMSDDVSLIIKTFPNPHNDVELQLNALQKNNPQFPHVEIINQDYSDAQIKGLYDICHAVVAPSRGEGFGLPIAEAMVFNLPVITTKWSGQLDFVNEENAWLCDYEFAQSNSHFQGMHSAWANSNIAHLTQLMKALYATSPEQIKTKTALAYQSVMTNFKWDDVANRTLTAIQSVKQQTSFMYEPNIAWISTWNARCGVASYSEYFTKQFPAHRLNILANYTDERTKRDADNVKRCWTASRSESMDYALEIILERQYKVVVIQYNFGFFSLATLASFIQQCKVHNIDIHIFFHATADTKWDDDFITLQSIASDLQTADKLYVHGIDDLNRLKQFGLVDNVVYFPQGLMPTIKSVPLPEQKPHKAHSPANKIIASYGFLLPHKGIQALIQAFAILAKSDPHLHLILVNAVYPVSISEHELYLCNCLIAEENLSQRVTVYADYLPDEQSQALLQTADLIVYPYQQTQESSSAAVRMGLAARKPIAVTPLSIFNDVKDIVHYLPGTTPLEIAQGIAQLLSDDALLNAKQEQASSWVEARQWPLLSTRLLNIIDGLANE